MAFANVRPALCGMGGPQDEAWSRQQVGAIEFRTVPGLSVEQVAASPLVERPIVAAWDDAGRLVVLEAAGPIDPEAEANGSCPHRMIRLVDRDHDGVFDQRIVAAEQLRFPEGVLCLGKNTLVSSPPEIWNLVDQDGDGVCERRDIWFDPGTLTHCRNDLHGPYLGRDGWVYWCKGAFAEQSHAVFNGQPLVSSAAHIFRRRLEGGASEVVMTGGMDNPVEVAFTPNGERFFTSTFVQYPAGGRRDGIVHAVYGGVYGKSHAPLDGHLRTGPLMPIMTHLGPAAPSGLIVPADTTLLLARGPADSVQTYTHSEFLVATQFNLQKVSVHRLIPEGASYRTEDRDLLVADRVEFHPTDVLQDADGSLLVLDTGGWYDLCCPSSALDQTGATGGIYRISSEETRRRRDPRGLALDWDSLDVATALQRLVHPSWWIANRAERWLESHSAEAEPGLVALLQHPTESRTLRSRVLWLLCRTDTAGAQSAIVASLSDRESAIRHAAALAVALHRWPAIEPLVTLLHSDVDPGVRRAAAEALGRLRDPAAVAPLMQVISDPKVSNDRVLRHSVLFALLEIAQPREVAPYLSDPESQRRRAAMLVLAELHSELLDPGNVFRTAVSTDPSDRDFALQILASRPGWSSGLAAPWEELWPTATANEFQREVVLALAAAWQGQLDIQQRIAAKIGAARDIDPAAQELLAGAIERIRPSRLPAGWSNPLAGWLAFESTPEAIRSRMIRWMQNVQLDPDDDRAVIAYLRETAEQPDVKLSLLIDCVEALPDQTPIGEPTIDRLLAATGSAGHPLRSSALQALARLRLPVGQAQQLLDQLSSLHPHDLPSAVVAIVHAGDEGLDRSLLAKLSELPGIRSMPSEVLVELFRDRSPPLRQLAQRTIAALAQPPAEIKPGLERLLSQLPQGDALRGMQVFRSAIANCSACHQVAYVGGIIGPDLSRIGAIRTRLELIEAIAYPNIRLEQSYRSVKITLTNGKTYNGLVDREDAETLELITGPDQRVRLAIADIEESQPSDVSVMPSGVAEQLSRQQLADLLAFLESRH